MEHGSSLPRIQCPPPFPILNQINPVQAPPPSILLPEDPSKYFPPIYAWVFQVFCRGKCGRDRKLATHCNQINAELENEWAINLLPRVCPWSTYKPLYLQGTLSFIIVFTRSRQWPIYWAVLFILLPCLFKICLKTRPQVLIRSLFKFLAKNLNFSSVPYEVSQISDSLLDLVWHSFDDASLNGLIEPLLKILARDAI
jgi:hypothetical protein